MALSGSYDFSQNRDSIIKDALRLAGVIDYSEDGDVDAEMINSASRTMNRMFKAWTADGLQVWKQIEAYLLLEKGKAEYDLGPTGDHWVTGFSSTEMRVAAAASVTTMEVDSTTGMTAADYVGVVTDDGTIHWTTIASVTDTDTFELTDALDDSAAIDNNVYWYTSKAQRPYRITECVIADENGSESLMYQLSREEYWNYTNKTQSGTPTLFYYDQALTNGNIFVYDITNRSTDYLVIAAHYPFQDMDAASDNIEFPDYWYEAIIDGLAYRFAVEYRAPRDVRAELRSIANKSKEEAMNFDVEGLSVFFQPEYRG